MNGPSSMRVPPLAGQFVANHQHDITKNLKTKNHTSIAVVSKSNSRLTEGNNYVYLSSPKS